MGETGGEKGRQKGEGKLDTSAPETHGSHLTLCPKKPPAVSIHLLLH